MNSAHMEGIDDMDAQNAGRRRPARPTVKAEYAKPEIVTMTAEDILSAIGPAQAVVSGVPGDGINLP